jgi:molybdopterin-guanine dinucleotide biosynthesis protein A
MGTPNVHINGIILAGGKSSRMGRDKALTLFRGKPMLQYAIDALKPIVDELYIVSNDAKHRWPGTTLVPDRIPDAGPLAGLYSGLAESTSELNLVLACDTPLVNTPLMQYLLKHYNGKDLALQVTVAGKSMPLIGLYHKSCAPSCLALLQNDERRLRKLAAHIPTQWLPLPQEMAGLAQNINDLESLEKLETYGNH